MKKFVSDSPEFTHDVIDKINKNNNSFLIIPTLSHYTAFVYIDLFFNSQRKKSRAKRIFMRQPS